MEKQKQIASMDLPEVNQCLTNLISFYDEFPGFLDERRVVGVIYLDFNKAFNVVSHNNLVSKSRHQRMDGWKKK